jgi:alkylation response protein AidB-like acyl-CoA dehydrogenase
MSLSHTSSEATLHPELLRWLENAADGLDLGNTLDPADVLPTLAQYGLPRVGVPTEYGGSGGAITDAIETIAAVSGRSLAAGLVLWGHRTYIEYLLQSPNHPLRQRLLPDLLNGSIAGATGLSNAMKFLSGLEDLQISAQPLQHGYRLDGKLHWVTNLRKEGFHVAAAVTRNDGCGAFIASLLSHDEGVLRSSDLDLIALRSTNTAALTISSAQITEDCILHPNAEQWLPIIRPAFLGLQIGMSIGLAHRSLAEACNGGGPGRHVLKPHIADLTEQLAAQQQALYLGLRSRAFETDPVPLFHIRIALAEIASQAVALELQASGGKAYLAEPGRGFARRWREAAFLPVITPSLVQLKTAIGSSQIT